MDKEIELTSEEKASKEPTFELPAELPADSSRHEIKAPSNFSAAWPVLVVALAAIIALGVVAGSQKKRKCKSECHCECPLPTTAEVSNSWVEIVPKGALPPERLAHAAVDVMDEYLYVHGGLYGTANASYDDLWRYHEPTDSWEQLATSSNGKPSPRLHHSMVNVNNAQLVIFGGFNVFSTQKHHDSSNDLYSLDIASNEWTRLGPNAGDDPWPSKRGAHEAIYLDGYMFVFGGFPTISATGHHAELWRYDIRQHSWLDLTPEDNTTAFPAGRIGFSWTVDDNKAFLFGGGCSDEASVGYDQGQCFDSWVYDPLVNSWTHLVPTGEIPLARRATHGDVAIEGLIFLYGGVNIAGGVVTMLDDFYVYDPLSNTWQRLHPNYDRGPKPPLMFGHSVSRLGDRVVVFGGRINAPSSPGSNILWEYNVMPPQCSAC